MSPAAPNAGDNDVRLLQGWSGTSAVTTGFTPTCSIALATLRIFPGVIVNDY